MNTYSVSVVSKMLNVNEETIRRWIRDEKLKAIRAVGRGGNTVYLEDVVDFANKPPRAYLIFLEEWLNDNGFPYERIEDAKDSDKTKVMGAITLGAGAATTATALAPAVLAVASSAAIAAPVGLGVAGIAYGASKLAKRKNQRTYSIRLISESSDKLQEGQNASKVDAVGEISFSPHSEQTLAESEDFSKDALYEVDITKEIPQQDVAMSASVLDRIAQAKQMVDVGIITPEEFAVIKTKLIERL